MSRLSIGLLRWLDGKLATAAAPDADGGQGRRQAPRRVALMACWTGARVVGGSPSPVLVKTLGHSGRPRSRDGPSGERYGLKTASPSKVLRSRRRLPDRVLRAEETIGAPTERAAAGVNRWPSATSGPGGLSVRSGFTCYAGSTPRLWTRRGARSRRASARPHGGSSAAARLSTGAIALSPACQ